MTAPGNLDLFGGSTELAPETGPACPACGARNDRRNPRDPRCSRCTVAGIEAPSLLSMGAGTLTVTIEQELQADDLAELEHVDPYMLCRHCGHHFDTHGADFGTPCTCGTCHGWTDEGPDPDPIAEAFRQSANRDRSNGR